ncbi:MAG: DUF3078 domain-containing protein [Bacteroidota bacterium]
MKTIILLFFILFYSFSYTQIRDSVKVLETNKVKVPIDTTKIIVELRELNAVDMLKNYDTIFTTELISINKKLIDSLLKPYYIISIDSYSKDTIFKPRYRMKINEFTNDTSYIVKPKVENYIRTKLDYGIDTLKIPEQVNQIKINKIVHVVDPEWWKNENSIAFDFNEVAFKNWNAGGENAISGLLKINFDRKYENQNILWENEIRIRYGLNKQEDRELRKTDDEIRINSTFGYKKEIDSKWYYSMKFNFNTQFTDGYKYPDTENPISRFFAPAYLFFGAGTQYILKPKYFIVYLSPLTFKSTFVHDKNLSAEGAFGIEKGKKSRIQFGTLIQSSWETEIFKNVAMVNKLSLYTDYFNNFGNIDVDWRLNFKFKINKLFEANIGTHLIYDDDIKYKEVNEEGEIEIFGARVQFMQQLGIGILYSF